MSCLRKQQIHLYLEGEMDAASAREAETHFLVCSRCREAYEERKILTEAARQLPDLEIPPAFAQEIMARITPSIRFPWVGSLAVFLSALAVSVLGSLAYFLSTGQGFPGLAISAGRAGGSFIRDAFLIFIEFAKLIVLAFKLLPPLAAKFAEALTRLSSLIKPEIYAFCIFSILALIILFFTAFRGKGFLGEKP